MPVAETEVAPDPGGLTQDMPAPAVPPTRVALEIGLAALALVAVTVAVAIVVFGLIVILYDPGSPLATATVAI